MNRIPVASEARGLIFDLDGTLADTMPLHHAAWHETFAAVGVTCPQTFLASLDGVPSPEIVQRYNRAFGADLDPVSVARAKERAVFARLADAHPIVPVVELARRYHGDLPLAVATGGVRANADAILQAIGMADAFEVVVTADDPVRPKPEPDIFLEAARRLGVPATSCQVFEDAEMGLEAARRAGMIVTDVRPFLNGAALTHSRP